MIRLALATLCALTCSLVLAGEATAPAAPAGAVPAVWPKKDWPSRNPVPYQDDPAVVKQLEALSAGTGLYLPPYKMTPDDVGKWHHTFKTGGPYRRGFGNKMAYAPDRKTAMYCGADHGTPHGLNDVWEYHLGSNTWNLICPPANDKYPLQRIAREEAAANKAIAEGKDIEKNKAILAKAEADTKAWWATCSVEDGYLQAKGNGGPVFPWHTWDGLAYDEKARRLYWAELDSDNYGDYPKHGVHTELTRRYCKYTGQDFDKIAAGLKKGASMYMYDPAQGRWMRHIGDGPLPYMRGMGGSLVYIPDLDRTIWYCAAQNVTPNDMQMWSFDAGANKWTDLKPNGGKSILALWHKDKVAPGSEVQMAYSPKHRKIVAVQGKGTFVFDLAKNEWSRGVDDDRVFGADYKGVFAYDSNADVFLLLSATGGQWADDWRLLAYDLNANKWEAAPIKGDDITKDKKLSPTGYYDPRLNALVVYSNSNATRVWVYRHATANQTGREK